MTATDETLEKPAETQICCAAVCDTFGPKLMPSELPSGAYMTNPSHSTLKVHGTRPSHETATSYPCVACGVAPTNWHSPSCEHSMKEIETEAFQNSIVYDLRQATAREASANPR